MDERVQGRARPVEQVAEQHGPEFLNPRRRVSSARMIVSRSGIVKASTFVIRL